jgi:hypothetical protein
MLLQWCYKGVTVVLKRCYSGVTVYHGLVRKPRLHRLIYLQGRGVDNANQNGPVLESTVQEKKADNI